MDAGRAAARARRFQCSVDGTSAYTVSAELCLSTSLTDLGCTADCGGGGFATCEAPAGLAAGEHTVSLGDLSVTFTVPTVVPFGGLCAGSPF